MTRVLAYGAKVYLLALVMVLLVGVSFAQTSNGTIAGVVTDSTGAAIVNAKVTATSVQRGDTRSMQTNSVGAYRFESVLPGTYSIEASAPGFAVTKLSKVTVVASVVTSVNATLSPGTTSQTVTVEATAQQLQTESGDITHTISTKEVSTLPIASLNPYALAVTLPGVQTASIDMTNGTSYSVNGARPRSNNFLIEGQDNNDAGIKGQGLQPENLEAIKEVSVLTNSYSAEFGNAAGSVANAIYESGTNQFHGAAWDRLENSSLDGTDHYYNLLGIPKSKYRENIFGFKLGGPIKKDKLFFFGSYQWDNYRSTQNGNSLTLPTANGVATLQSLLPTATATQAQQINNLLSAIGSLRGLTQPSPIALGDGRPDVEVGRVAREGMAAMSNSPELDLKGDYLITSKDTLSLRYIHTSYTSPFDLGNFPTQLPGFDTQQQGAAHNAGITYTRIFTPKLINELRISYGRIGFTFDPRADSLANPLATQPAISIAGLTGWGLPTSVPQGRFHNTMQFQDAVTWQTGKHFFKFGTDIADVRVRDQIPFNIYGSIGYAGSKYTDPTTGAITSYTGLANYIDNYGGTSATETINFGNPVVRPEMLQQAYYFQDSWKVRPNLTLDYGLRWEYSGTPANWVKYPAIVEAVGQLAPSDYPTRVEQKPDYEDFAPRFGFAYTPHFWTSVLGENKTVIRGGFGVFYDGIFTNIIDNIQASTPNASAPNHTSLVNASAVRGTANWSSQFATLSPVFSPLSSQQAIANNLKSPETLQWNLAVERELPMHFNLTTSYVGTRGERLFGFNYVNPFDPNTGTRVIPTRGGIYVDDNSGDSIYHAFDASLERRMGHGLMFRGAYTYSHNIDDVSEVFTTGNWSTYPSVQWPTPRGQYDRGNSAYDHRQRLAISYVYDLPKWNASGAFSPVAYVLNNWHMSGTVAFQSGAPGNVEIGYDNNGDGISNDRPNLGNPNAPLASYAWDNGDGTYCAGAALWNGKGCNLVDASSVHWIVPYSGAGDVGRNGFRTPGTQTWTFSLARDFKITERQKFEFRTEMFNPFNHADTGIPNLTLTSGIPYIDPAKPAPTTSFANVPLTVSGNRSIRFYLKYEF